MKKLVLAFTAVSLVAGASAPSFAAVACRDKAGKFIKCPVKARVCRNAKGHFAKCK